MISLYPKEKKLSNNKKLWILSEIIFAAYSLEIGNLCDKYGEDEVFDLLATSKWQEIIELNIAIMELYCEVKHNNKKLETFCLSGNLEII